MLMITPNGSPLYISTNNGIPGFSLSAVNYCSLDAFMLWKSGNNGRFDVQLLYKMHKVAFTGIVDDGLFVLSRVGLYFLEDVSGSFGLDYAICTENCSELVVNFHFNKAFSSFGRSILLSPK